MTQGGAGAAVAAVIRATSLIAQEGTRPAAGPAVEEGDAANTPSWGSPGIPPCHGAGKEEEGGSPLPRARRRWESQLGQGQLAGTAMGAVPLRRKESVEIAA